jgi:hypothetical protein
MAILLYNVLTYAKLIPIIQLIWLFCYQCIDVRKVDPNHSAHMAILLYNVLTYAKLIPIIQLIWLFCYTMY